MTLYGRFGFVSEKDQAGPDNEHEQLNELNKPHLP
jgi:hypothetical protein